MRRGLVKRAIGCAGALVVLLPACGNQATSAPRNFAVTEAKMCRDVDEARRPIGVTTDFPSETDRMHCWFAWKDASRGLQLTARWYYVSEDFHILDVPVSLTRVSDYGVVSLIMPQGKTLPSGSYRLELKAGKKIVKTLTFTVLPSSPAPPAGS